MRFVPKACLAAILVCGVGGVARAQLLYSFESGLDGFFATSGASSVAAETTIGVTEGSTSLRYSLITPATFEGARTETVIPAALADPPGVSAIMFDLTIVDAFAGGFASLGITTFGVADGPTYNQFQFADFVALEALAPGTYTDMTISLEQTFGGGPSFNDLYGSEPGGYAATGFQFFINKSGTAPITIYIDNVRAVVPEPATLGLLAFGLMSGLGVRRR